MAHRTIGWTVVAVGMTTALVVVQSLTQPSWWLRTFLLVIAAALVLYGGWWILRGPKPKLDVLAELVGVGQWKTPDTTGFQVEITVVLDWEQPLQLQFILVLPDGTRVENDEYHRAYLSGDSPQGFWDNPKQCNPGQTGPFKIAFLVPATCFGDSPHPPRKGLELLYTSVLPGLASGSTLLDHGKAGS